MKRKIVLAGCFLLGAAALFAQDQDAGHWPVTLGLKGGIPVTDMFTTGASNGSLYFTSATPRYEFGPSAEFHIPFHLRFEVDGLYKRGGFDSTLNITGQSQNPFAFTRTSFNQWEIPALLKYNVTVGHFRPFLDFGASYRHISTISQASAFPGAQTTYSDNSNYLRNRNSFGGVAGFGITFKEGPFEITPEARYTRWANNSFAGPGITSNKDQGDVLIGISF